MNEQDPLIAPPADGMSATPKALLEARMLSAQKELELAELSLSSNGKPGMEKIYEARIAAAKKSISDLEQELSSQ